jgi:hypothetical protein
LKQFVFSGIIELSISHECNWVLLCGIAEKFKKFKSDSRIASRFFLFFFVLLYMIEKALFSGWKS